MPSHYNCECGSTVLNKNKARHLKTKRHMRYDDLYNFDKNPVLQLVPQRFPRCLGS